MIYIYHEKSDDNVLILWCLTSLIMKNNNHILLDIAGADDGIEEIEGGGVILKCLQTRTGIKFVLT